MKTTTRRTRKVPGTFAAIARYAPARAPWRTAVCMAMLGLLLFGVGCDDEPISQYTVPKGSEPIVENPAAVNAADATDRSQPAERPEASAGWVVPEGWQELDESRAMRVTTFVVDDQAGPAEVAVSRFAGDVGGMLANVNRWREQIDLDPITQPALDDLLTPFQSPGFEGHLLHLRGPTQHMIVASIHEPAADRTWFVRLIAAQPVAERLKPQVFRFARSFGTADASDTQSQSEEQ